MITTQRVLRVLALVALLMITVSLYAQEATEEPSTEEMPIEEVEGTEISVLGSGVVNPAFEAIVDASGSILDYSVSTVGTDAGFEAFCSGTADIATAVRAINVEEDAACGEAGVEFIELLIGYEVLAVVRNPDDGFLTCLSDDNLDVLYAPSANITNWDDLGLASTAPVGAAAAESTEEPNMMPDVTVLLPEDTSSLYETLDGIVSGFGFTANATSTDSASIIETVSSTSGAIGVVRLSEAVAAGESVALVDLNVNGLGCNTPSAGAIEADLYPANTGLYLYVNTAAQDDLAFLLDYVTSTDVEAGLSDAGFTAVSADALELNAAIISGDVSARAATAEEITYTIPAGLSGAINVVGSTSGFTIANSTATNLTSTQQGLTINLNLLGETTGIEAFCNDEADILFVENTPENLCDAAVETVDYDFGQQAVVLVANADNDFNTCLTPEQINTVWGISASEPVTQWSGVSDAFPETDIVLVGITPGNVLTDILMSNVSDGAPLPVRVDVAETNGDPSYRATAVSIVDGALTYMSWNAYQTILEDGHTGTQLVAINTGEGCVVPSEETILDGTYPLARGLTMVVKQSLLATVHGQSYVWTLVSNPQSGVIASLDFVGGLGEIETTELRSDLLAAFSDAEQAVNDAAEAEATPEVTPEATEEADE